MSNLRSVSVVMLQPLSFLCVCAPAARSASKTWPPATGRTWGLLQGAPLCCLGGVWGVRPFAHAPHTVGSRHAPSCSTCPICRTAIDIGALKTVDCIASGGDGADAMDLVALPRVRGQGRRGLWALDSARVEACFATCADDVHVQLVACVRSCGISPHGTHCSLPGCCVSQATAR